MNGTGVCDCCGKSSDDLMPSFWSDRTRWFCSIDCLHIFKALAIGSKYDEQVIGGEPGTAKAIFGKLKLEGSWK